MPSNSAGIVTIFQFLLRPCYYTNNLSYSLATENYINKSAPGQMVSRTLQHIRHGRSTSPTVTLNDCKSTKAKINDDEYADDDGEEQTVKYDITMHGFRDLSAEGASKFQNPSFSKHGTVTTWSIWRTCSSTGDRLTALSLVFFAHACMLCLRSTGDSDMLLLRDICYWSCQSWYRRAVALLYIDSMSFSLSLTEESNTIHTLIDSHAHIASAP